MEDSETESENIDSDYQMDKTQTHTSYADKECSKTWPKLRIK